MVQTSGPGRTHGLQRTGQRRGRLGWPGRGVVRAWRIDGKECYDDCDGYMVGVHKSTSYQPGSENEENTNHPMA